MKKRIFWGILVLIVGLGFSNTLWAEVGVTDTEIVVGSEQDLSGPIAVLGVQIKNGLDMKIKEINEAGGIHGRKIRLVVGDHGYDPKKAIMLTNKLINRDKVFCFVSILGTAPAVAVKPIITKKKIPFLFPVSASESAYMPFNRYAFALVVPYRGQGGILAKYGVKTKGYKKFGLMTILAGLTRRPWLANVLQAAFFCALNLKAFGFFGISNHPLLVASLVASFAVNVALGALYQRYGLAAAALTHGIIDLKFVVHAVIV